MEEKRKITLGTVISNLDAIVTGATLALATIIVNANVLMRYFFKKPLFWAEEVATGLFVWTVFVGSAYAYRRHAHLGVDILVNALPGKLKSVVKFIIQILELLVLVMLTYVSVLYLTNTWDKLSNTLRIPSWYVACAVPLGFGISLIHSIIFLAKDLRAYFKGKGGAGS